MNLFASPFASNSDRPQAQRIASIMSQEQFGFRGALLGKRREGKTDLLRQIQVLLFDKAEGPIPFFYSFAAERKDAAMAHHFIAAFCLQVRAFLMRQEEVLQEPPASVERELEKAGLPLSLAEMARHFLELDPEHQPDFAAALPAQFAHREDRPVCLLFDDVQELARSAPYFSSLDSHHLCWLLSGRYPYILRAAGDQAWPLVRVEPFTQEEVLSQARKYCQALNIHFVRPVWEHWCNFAGTSLWLIGSLLTAAAVKGEPIDSVEELGRLYAHELTSGTLGNWLSRRFEKAVPDSTDRAVLAEHFRLAIHSGAPPSIAAALPARVWDGLIAEEWAEPGAAAPRLVLDSLERDWVSAAILPAAESAERARARLVQAFLLRGESRQEAEATSFSAVIHNRILDLPHFGFPASFVFEGEQIPLPRIVSVSAEPAPKAELFWCYGFYKDIATAAESAVVLLIAVCDSSPGDLQVQKWSNQLEREIHMTEAAAGPAQPGIRQQLWVAVPPETSLAATGSERRFPWQTIFRLLMQSETPDTLPPFHSQP